MNKIKGFTMLELLISVGLGLLIVAAGIQVFVNSSQSMRLQQSNANVQNSGLFGLDYIVRDVRRANIDSNSAAMTRDLLHGGVVLTKANLSNNTAVSVNEDLLSRSSIGPSNLKDLKSDQLVVQYRNTVGSQFDCEGQQIFPNQYVVQRYFVHQESPATTTNPFPTLSLRCKSVTYTGSSISALDLSGAGSVVIPNVDHFRVLLTVAKDTTTPPDARMDTFTNVSLSEYMKLNDKPQIVAVKLGLIVRSPENVAQGTSATKFTLLDLENKALISEAERPQFVRQVLTQTVALRNGFGVKNSTE